MNNHFYQKGLVIVLIIALLVMAGVGIKIKSKEQEIAFTAFEDYNNETVDEKANDEKPKGTIYVDIDGAVNNPGVYELHDGDRVNDAIIKAGGLMDNAYTKNLNKAKKLIDGEKIYIITEEEALKEEKLKESSKLINLNTASMNDLMSLPGIGEVYAQRIIDYRSKKSFAQIDDIKNISGIGEKTFEKIKDLITVD